jgi:hypothetical protein
MPAAAPNGFQEDFEFGVDEQDWAAVKLLTDELEEELAERRNHLLFRISVWLLAVRVFKKSETRKIVLRTPSDRDKTYHRALLGFLKGYGEMLLMELGRQNAMDSKDIGVSFEDFSASVEELRLSEREWYGDMTQARREEIFLNVFGENS